MFKSLVLILSNVSYGLTYLFGLLDDLSLVPMTHRRQKNISLSQDTFISLYRVLILSDVTYKQIQPPITFINKNKHFELIN